MGFEFLGAAGAVAVAVAIVLAVLPTVLVIVALWRIGSGLHAIAFELRGDDGTKSLTESAELQAKAVAKWAGFDED